MTTATDATDDATLEELTDYERYRTPRRGHTAEPDDRLDAAEGATVADALELERRAAEVGVELEDNYLAYIADDHSEFPAGKEHAANAQARFVAGEDPIDEYRDYDGHHGIKEILDDGHAGTDGSDKLALIRANLIAGRSAFADTRYQEVARVYADDLPDDRDDHDERRKSFHAGLYERDDVTDYASGLKPTDNVIVGVEGDVDNCPEGITELANQNGFVRDDGHFLDGDFSAWENETDFVFKYAPDEADA